MTGRRKSGAQPRALKFARVPNPLMYQPCIEIVSHARTKKGYLQLRPRDGKRRSHINAHRLAFISKNGPIPPGWEVDHICGNRACVNRSHLRLIERSDHKRITNAARSAARIEEAWAIWETEGRPGGTLLGKLLGIPQTTASRWIRLWLAEDEALAA